MKTLIYFKKLHVSQVSTMSIPAVHAMGLLVVVGHLDPGGH